MDALPTAFLIERHLIFASLYDLSAVVFGSEGLARLSDGSHGDEFDKLRVRHEVAQGTKLLIEIAVVLRNLIDGGAWPTDVIHEIRIERRPEMDVGVVRQAGKADCNLSFREACNKIIHAEKVSFEMRSFLENMKYLSGMVQLHGKKGYQSWVAEVDLSKFIRMAVRLL